MIITVTDACVDRCSDQLIAPSGGNDGDREAYARSARNAPLSLVSSASPNLSRCRRTYPPPFPFHPDRQRFPGHPKNLQLPTFHFSIVPDSPCFLCPTPFSATLTHPGNSYLARTLIVMGGRRRRVEDGQRYDTHEKGHSVGSGDLQPKPLWGQVIYLRRRAAIHCLIFYFRRHHSPR